MPSDENPPITAEVSEKIMHISYPISKETMLMGSDVIGRHTESFVEGNNFAVSINTESTQEADRLFQILSEGGIVTMPLGKTFWGAYFGMFTDKFGIN